MARIMCMMIDFMMRMSREGQDVDVRDGEFMDAVLGSGIDAVNVFSDASSEVVEDDLGNVADVQESPFVYFELLYFHYSFFKKTLVFK